jgi:hypothetical protein
VSFAASRAKVYELRIKEDHRGVYELRIKEDHRTNTAGMLRHVASKKSKKTMLSESCSFPTGSLNMNEVDEAPDRGQIDYDV